MNHLFTYIDQNPLQTIVVFVAALGIGWLFYEFKNAQNYEHDDF